MQIDEGELWPEKVAKACGIAITAALWIYLNFYFYELAMRLYEEDYTHPFLGIAKNAGPVTVYFHFFFMAMTPGSVGIVLSWLGYMVDWWRNRDIRRYQREMAARQEAEIYARLGVVPLEKEPYKKMLFHCAMIYIIPPLALGAGGFILFVGVPWVAVNVSILLGIVVAIIGVIIFFFSLLIVHGLYFED